MEFLGTLWPTTSRVAIAETLSYVFEMPRSASAKKITPQAPTRRPAKAGSSVAAMKKEAARLRSIASLHEVTQATPEELEEARRLWLD